MNKIRIGTRTSALAMKQTELIAERLKDLAADMEVELVPIRTKGDKILDQSLASFGGKGAFVTEFEEALLSDKIDLAVHSAKDLPVGLAKGLYICATPEREDPRDVLVTGRDQRIIKSIGEGNLGESGILRPVIGTSSPRRAEQIRALLPAEVKLLRGNVPTRIEKLKSGEYDGILLAAAGLKRLDLMRDEELSYRMLSYEEMTPAGGQGIIAVEGRLGDGASELASCLSDSVCAVEFETERFLLTRLGAGCHEAVGAFSKVSGEEIRIYLMTMHGGKILKTSISGFVEERLELAEKLLGQHGVRYERYE